MAHLYLVDDLPAAGLSAGETASVSGEEARHAVRVARLRVGEVIRLGDGAGALAEGEVVEADRDRFSVRLERAWRVEAPTPRLTLVQALAKGDRDERAVEQATEFGVDQVWPWQAARSVARWEGAKADRGVEKWQRIAREAAKQALRSHVPRVGALRHLDQLAELAGAPGTQMAVLHPAGTSALAAWANSEPVRQAAEVMLVIGPEGGLSEAELSRLAASGADAVRLGDLVLRTSSAGPAALAVLNVALGRW